MKQTTINLEVLPDVSNAAFLPLLNNKDRWLVLFGGAGSGKSEFVAMKILYRICEAMSKGKVHKFLCLRKTQPAARHSIFSLICKYISDWGLMPDCKINRSDMTIKFHGGSEILITGLDNPEKIKSIHGITGIWLEEATEFTYADFMQLDLRLRGKTWDYKQIMLSFNPIDENHWIRKELFTDVMCRQIEDGQKVVNHTVTHEVDKKVIEIGLTAMHSTYQDNRFLDDTYRARLEALCDQDKNYYNIYTLGKWGVLKGLIFERYEITRKWPTQFDDHGFGLDFGYSVHPTGIVEVGFIGKRLYIRERCYKTEMTNRDIAAKLLKIAPDALVVADCAEPKSIAEIRSYGQPCVACTKGKDSISNGIQRIKQFELYVDYHSPNLIKELQGYKWAENANGELLNKPVDYNNHLIDALRYIVTRLKGMRKPCIGIVDLENEEHKPTYTASDTDVADAEAEEIWQTI